MRQFVVKNPIFKFDMPLCLRGLSKCNMGDTMQALEDSSFNISNNNGDGEIFEQRDI